MNECTSLDSPLDGLDVTGAPVRLSSVDTTLNLFLDGLSFCPVDGSLVVVFLAVVAVKLVSNSEVPLCIGVQVAFVVSVVVALVTRPFYFVGKEHRAAEPGRPRAVPAHQRRLAAQ